MSVHVEQVGGLAFLHVHEEKVWLMFTPLHNPPAHDYFPPPTHGAQLLSSAKLPLAPAGLFTAVSQLLHRGGPAAADPAAGSRNGAGGGQAEQDGRRRK